MQLIIHTNIEKVLKIDVATLEEASLTWTAYRNGDNPNYEHLGASQMRGRCGDVLEKGKKVAQIAYNGKIITE